MRWHLENGAIIVLILLGLIKNLSLHERVV
jgi:hypothetical protein